MGLDMHMGVYLRHHLLEEEGLEDMHMHTLGMSMHMGMRMGMHMRVCLRHHILEEEGLEDWLEEAGLEPVEGRHVGEDLAACACAYACARARACAK